MATTKKTYWATTIDEAREVYRDREEYDDASVRRAKEMIERDALETWGSGEFKPVFAPAEYDDVEEKYDDSGCDYCGSAEHSARTFADCPDADGFAVEDYNAGGF